MSITLPSYAPLRPTGLSAPAMYLMGRYMFPIKAMIISLVFLLPLAYLMVNLYQAQNTQLQFTEQERHGVRMMTAFQPVMHGLLDVRNATRAGLAGGALDTRADYMAARHKVDEALNGLEVAVHLHGDPLALQGDVAKLKLAFASTAASKSGVDGAGRTVFGPVTSAAVELLQGLGDRSNLVLDPDLDSFYLMNALVLTLPQALEDLGQLWGWGTFAIQKGFLAVNDERRYVVWDAGASTGLKAAREHMGRAITYNASLKSELDLTGLDLAVAFREKVKSVDDMMTSNLSAEGVYADGKKAVAAAMGVYRSGLTALDDLLLQRQARLEKVLWFSLVSIVAAIVLAIYLFYAFYRVMHGGLSTVGGHLGELAVGDLRRRPDAPWARDETAMLITHLGDTYDSLQALIRKVSHVSGELNLASHEIADSSADLARRTAETASALEQQAQSMGDIGTIVGGTAITAQQAADFSARNAQVSNQAGQTISQVVTTMQGIHASSAKINDIIGVIDGIAFQTNILALNAAVEAARAGDAGRGFAVVATEVRNLAQRSAGAAKEIKTLISGSVEKIDEGTAVVQNAGNIMVEVLDNARQVNTLLAQIATSSQQQAAGVAQAVRSIQELDRNTQQNAALVEETTAAATALKAQANNLDSDIQRFRVA